MLLNSLHVFSKAEQRGFSWSCKEPYRALHMYNLPSAGGEYQSVQTYFQNIRKSFMFPIPFLPWFPQCAAFVLSCWISSFKQSWHKIQPQKRPVFFFLFYTHHPLGCVCQSRKKIDMSAKPQNWPLDRNFNTKSANIMHILVSRKTLNASLMMIWSKIAITVDQKCSLLNVGIVKIKRNCD